MRAFEAWDALRAAFRAWTGIELPTSGASLAVDALTERAQQTGLGIQGYLQRATDKAGLERQSLIDALVINTTWFMREVAGIESLVKELTRLASRRGHPEVRLWSVGCSTGQEPYSLAMALAEARLQPRILATDISHSCLEAARQGVYPIHRLNAIPPDWVRRHLESIDDRHVKVRSHLRSYVTFSRHNLLDSQDPPLGGWQGLDAVVCRNVLIYFDREHAVRMIGRFGTHLHDDGFVLLGSAEQPLVWMSDSLVVAEDSADAVLLRPARGRYVDAPRSRLVARPGSGSRERLAVRTAGARTRPATAASAALRKTAPVQQAADVALIRAGQAPAKRARDARAARNSPQGRNTDRLLRTTSEFRRPPELEALARVLDEADGEAEAPRRRRERPGQAPATGDRQRPPPRRSTDRLATEDARNQLETADRLSREGDPVAALAHVDGLLARRSVLAPAHLVRGLILKRMGRTADAVEAFRKARFLTADDGWMAPYQLALGLEQLGRASDAREAYRHAIAVLEAGGASGLVNARDDELVATTVLESCRMRLRSLT